MLHHLYENSTRMPERVRERVFHRQDTVIGRVSQAA